jgi:hypothetical protein
MKNHISFNRLGGFPVNVGFLVLIAIMNGCDAASLDPKIAVKETALAGQKYLILDINSFNSPEQYDSLIAYWQNIKTKHCPQDFREKFEEWRSLEIKWLENCKAGDHKAANDMGKLTFGKDALDLAEQKYGYKRRISFKLIPYSEWIEWIKRDDI